MKFDHVLLTTDLSGEALRAFGPVIEMAKVLGARLTVLNVVQDLRVAPHGAPLAPMVSMPDLEKEMDEVRVELEKQCRSIEGIDAKAVVISHESPAKGIVEYAAENSVDLIALSTHGRTGFRRLALGSVAEAVLRHSPVPVLSFHRPD